MLRLIGAIVGGIVVGVVVVLVTDMVVRALAGSAVMPTDRDAAAMRAYMEALPVAALAAFVIGCGVAAFAGSAVAARFGGRGAWPGWVVAGVVLLSTIANFAMIPHPLWVVIGGVLAVTAGGWLGARTFARRRSI